MAFASYLSHGFPSGLKGFMVSPCWIKYVFRHNIISFEWLLLFFINIRLLLHIHQGGAQDHLKHAYYPRDESIFQCFLFETHYHKAIINY